MKSNAINTLRRSKHLMLSIALTLAPVLSPAQSNAQQLQRGVSVQLAATTNAASMPDADNHDAWIVTVTADGSLYFGIDPVTPASLADEMKRLPRNRDQKLYIKADARAPFADVKRALAAGHEVAFETAVFLSSQPESSAAGTMVPPKGLEVLLGPLSNSIVVQVSNGGHQGPTLKINNQQIPAAALQTTLTQLLQNRSEKVVTVNADGQLPFADVIHVIASCRSAGARIALAAPSI
jgi:biopolymer transport protein ExbD